MVTKSMFMPNRTGLWFVVRSWWVVLLLQGCLPSRPTPPAGGNVPAPTIVSEHLTLGNPSEAAQADPDNYLIIKPQFTLSFNRSRGIANWVSWHLSRNWRGDAPRTKTFRPDPDLPTGYTAARNADYERTGFDKGHLCPSEDRDSSPADNAATFVLSNVVPQSPNLNRGTWKALEDYARKRVNEGNEVYIVAGATGSGGTGENGEAISLANGKITVPAYCWKVLLILPDGDDDLRRIGPNTEVVAVYMPNQQGASAMRWQAYRLSVNELEQKTRLRFFTNLPQDVQGVLKAQTGGRF
jgi:endonuclease G, mitochondrial